MTDSRQHAESITLQPCRIAAAVGNIIYVRVACPRYASASCLCRNLSFVTPPYHTCFCCAAAGCACPSMRKHRDLCNSNNLDTNPSLYIYVHREAVFNEYFFCSFSAKFADDRQQATCGEQNATGRTMCACRILSLRRRVAFVIACHVLSSCSLVLNTCSLYNILQ